MDWWEANARGAETHADEERAQNTGMSQFVHDVDGVMRQEAFTRARGTGQQTLAGESRKPTVRLVFDPYPRPRSVHAF